MLPNQGGYKKQFEKKLKQDVGKMKMSVGEYYARKADMYETLMTGHDSKESQTQGLSILIVSVSINFMILVFLFQSAVEAKHKFYSK